MKKPKLKRTGQVRMQQAYDMVQSGKTVDEVAEEMGIQRKSVINFVWRVRDKAMEVRCDTCDTCGEIITGKVEKFRGKKYCVKHFLEAEPSKCEGLTIVGWDPTRRQMESNFDVSASAPRRTHGVLQ